MVCWRIIQIKESIIIEDPATFAFIGAAIAGHILSDMAGIPDINNST